MAKDARQIAELWVQKMAQSADKYKSGVNGVTTSPMEAAAAAKDRYLAGIQAAAAEGRWEAGLRRTSLSAWKAKTASKGAERLASGARDAKEDMIRFQTEWLPVSERISAECAEMPKGTIEDSLQRVRKMMEMARQFKQARAG